MRAPRNSPRDNRPTGAKLERTALQTVPGVEWTVEHADQTRGYAHHKHCESSRGLILFGRFPDSETSWRIRGWSSRHRRFAAAICGPGDKLTGHVLKARTAIAARALNYWWLREGFAEMQKLSNPFPKLPGLEFPW